MINEYQIVATNNIDGFIETGYQPYGSPFVVGGASFQAIVKYTPSTATELNKKENK